MNEVSELISQIDDGDTVAAGDTVNNILANKIGDALKQKKIEVSSRIYGTTATEVEVEGESKAEIARD